MSDVRSEEHLAKMAQSLGGMFTNTLMKEWQTTTSRGRGRYLYLQRLKRLQAMGFITPADILNLLGPKVIKHLAQQGDNYFKELFASYQKAMAAKKDEENYRVVTRQPDGECAPGETPEGQGDSGDPDDIGGL